MKKSIITFLLLITNYFFAQKINPNYNTAVTYNGELQIGDKIRKNEEFVLLIEESSYYFGSKQSFINDSKTDEERENVPFGDLSEFSSYFKERVYYSHNNFSVFQHIYGSRLAYNEKAMTNWVLYSDTKIINGVKCQMAATNKYGRRWIAYFSKEYPFSYGPYKFSGLPGLIFEIYDTRNDYHFTLTSIKKNNAQLKIRLSQFKFIDKKKYTETCYNLNYTIASFPKLDGETRDEMIKAKEILRKRENNPLELKLE